MSYSITPSGNSLVMYGAETNVGVTLLGVGYTTIGASVPANPLSPVTVQFYNPATSTITTETVSVNGQHWVGGQKVDIMHVAWSGRTLAGQPVHVYPAQQNINVTNITQTLQQFRDLPPMQITAAQVLQDPNIYHDRIMYAAAKVGTPTPAPNSIDTAATAITPGNGQTPSYPNGPGYYGGTSSSGGTSPSSSGGGTGNTGNNPGNPNAPGYYGGGSSNAGHYAEVAAGNVRSGLPVVLDLNGNGIEISLSYKAAFDYNGNGFRQPTAWVAPGDGFLVIDLNADGTRGLGDGKIDQAKELVLSQWGPAGSTDLQAIAQATGAAGNKIFDTNGDGLLTAADTSFGEFRVWQDLNQNGTVEACLGTNENE